MITNEVIESFIVCKYKAYLKSNCITGDKTEFECLQSEILELRKTNFYNNIRVKSSENQILRDLDFKDKNQVKVDAFVITPHFKSKKYNISLDALYISPKKPLRKHLYTPLLISSHGTAPKIEKLILCLKCLIIFQPIKAMPEFGKVIHGHELRTTKFNLTPYIKEAKKTLAEIDNIINSDKPPQFYHNSHCNICEFQHPCRQNLIKRDDLSLLGRISQKEINKQNNKGIFTIQQLSYTFKPRKRRKISKNQRFLWELKALALKEKQTYILETPKIPESVTEIFLDIEGLPDENLNYLIGLTIKDGKDEKHLSLWADSKQNELEIFKQLFSIILKFNDFIIYHYGNYEIRALKNMSKLLEDFDISRIIEKSTNILALFHANVYPPCYGNGLKEIAGVLGFEWSDAGASGIQSIVWRKRWELSGDPEYKVKLLRYNSEDCFALKLIKDWLIDIIEKIRHGDKSNFIKTDDLKRKKHL